MTTSAVIIFVTLAIGSGSNGFLRQSTRPSSRSNTSPAVGGCFQFIVNALRAPGSCSTGPPLPGPPSSRATASGPFDAVCAPRSWLISAPAPSPEPAVRVAGSSPRAASSPAAPPPTITAAARGASQRMRRCRRARAAARRRSSRHAWRSSRVAGIAGRAAFAFPPPLIRAVRASAWAAPRVRRAGHAAGRARRRRAGRPRRPRGRWRRRRRPRRCRSVLVRPTGPGRACRPERRTGGRSRGCARSGDPGARRSRGRGQQHGPRPDGAPPGLVGRVGEGQVGAGHRLADGSAGPGLPPPIRAQRGASTIWPAVDRRARGSARASPTRQVPRRNARAERKTRPRDDRVRPPRSVESRVRPRRPVPRWPGSDAPLHRAP